MFSAQNKTSDTVWTDLLNESVHTSDDIDIGDIDAVSKDFVVVKRGFINIHYYYIPMKYVEGWDGNVLWLNVKENRVKAKFERDIIPDPYRFYIKDFPYYATSVYPVVTMLPSRYTRPIYQKSSTTMYICPLCKEELDDESKVSKHIESAH